MIPLRNSSLTIPCPHSLLLIVLFKIPESEKGFKYSWAEVVRLEKPLADGNWSPRCNTAKIMSLGPLTQINAVGYWQVVVVPYGLAIVAWRFIAR